MPLPSSIKTNKASLLNITSMKMSESIYDQLSDEEKAALTYAIVFPHRTLRAVLPELFNTSWHSGLYKRHDRGRESLKRRGFLDDKSNPTDLALEILPTEALRKMVKELTREIRTEYAKRSKIELEKNDCEYKCKNLENKNEELSRIQEKFKRITEIIETFSFLGVDENWISVLICTNLVEQAMKKKLEELGSEIKGKPSFKDIREALGNALKEKEARTLDALFEPKELWRIRSKMDHWGYKMKIDKDKAHAIFVMTKDIINDIWRST